jgi:hypothetical protein
MLKIFQIAVGIVFFVVIPVVARMEKYLEHPQGGN